MKQEPISAEELKDHIENAKLIYVAQFPPEKYGEDSDCEEVYTTLEEAETFIAAHIAHSAALTSPALGWVNEINKARFWSKCTQTGYCWEWGGSKNTDGYGMIKIHGQYLISSRVAYQIINGPIQNELHVLHKCDNPGCINPDHLFTGTHQDNMHDKVRKGRGKILGRASKYHGVAFRKDSNNWRAQIWDGRKHISIGSFQSEEDAGRARDLEVIKRKLDLKLNFPI